jgi:hypothetical protein
VLARCQEDVHALPHLWLVRGKAEGVCHCLTDRTAAVEHQAWEGEATPASKAWTSVPRGDGDRAEEADIVKLQHHPHSEAARTQERPGAEHRVKVVYVDDGCTNFVDCASDVLIRKSTGNQGKAACEPGRLCGRPLSKPMTNVGCGESLHLERDRTLLSAAQAVTVVDDDDTSRICLHESILIPAAT